VIDHVALLKLRFAVSIISNDNELFNNTVEDVKERDIEELNWILGRSPRDLRNAMGTKGREIMNHALYCTIHEGDKKAVLDIVNFCS
jgi:hypothetical protein